MPEYTAFSLAYVIAFGGAALAIYGMWRLRGRRIAPAALAIPAAIAIFFGVYFFWYTHRPLPESGTWALFDGIAYTREVITDPVPMVVHIVRIDLNAPDLGFLVTPRDDIAGGDYAARTVSQFREEHGLRLAINADFFDPWRDYGLTNYYPHVGDPVNARGLTISDGETVTVGYAQISSEETLYLTADNRAVFDTVPDDALNAVSGNARLLRGGVTMAFNGMDSYLETRHPRAAVAVDETGGTLIFVLVDGRQPTYSDGAMLVELADIVRRHGGYDALNLDGGGSVALVIEGENGGSVLLNSPIHNRIPGRERPVANHLGVR